jgi:transcriptional regulator with XRE-family HTH domain
MVVSSESRSAQEKNATELGARLRHARLLLGLSLKSVAELSECSESMVSKVERGLVEPSLAMLHRLAGALRTNVSDLIAADWPKDGPVLTARDRQTYPLDAALSKLPVRMEKLTTFVRGGLLQANIHIVEPGGRSDGQISHIGEEVGYVLEGEVLLHLADKSYKLGPTDSFHFASHISHGYENIGTGLARILWVNTPATF